MHVLITRPMPDAWATKAQIERLGIETSLAPLLDIQFVDLAPEALEGASAVIVTSKNALRSLAFSGLADLVRPLQVYAVGEATALLAVELKLRNITAGRSGAEELVPVIAERQASRPGKIIHLVGDHKAFDLSGALAEKNIPVTEILVYRQVAAESLPAAVAAAVKAGRIDTVALYSPRTAEIWHRLATQHGLQSQVARMTHVCLSDAVAARLGSEPKVEIAVAQDPTEQEILALIKGLAAGAEQR